ncbi:hypothetical protein [Priestia megaterium]|uniref:hypothetical protein n=1 Tax=Priestia megaterium TaxID=1404 RepID=UPI000BFB3DAF|nr:hypothetical protein [Priestia megaterium]PGO60651.1 hypothetical protein CN981_08870 [Priestia megaterium]
MFKFQRIIAGGYKWVDNLFVEDEHIGTMGYDEEGIYFNLKRNLSLKEMNLLIAQVTMSNPDLLQDNFEMRKI